VERIKENADAEFSILWKTSRENGRPLSGLSDELSARILEVTAGVEASSLFDDTTLLSNVIPLHVPSALIGAVGGIERLLDHLPRPYLKAIFARTIARRFVYEYGVEPSYEDYRLFVDRLRSAPSDRSIAGDRVRPT